MGVWFLVTGASTLASALLGLAFSLVFLQRETGPGKTNAQYLLVRSTALVLLVLLALGSRQASLLTAATAVLLAVQALDALIGLRTKNRLRTFGPLLLAAVHSGCLMYRFLP